MIFGGSIGPKAGLTGVVAGLCTWAGDKFKHLFKEMKELTKIGISATLGTIFKAPMFGFIEPIESKEETTLPKTSKIVVYFLAIFSAFGIFILFNHFFHGNLSMATFSGLEIGTREWLWLIPFSRIGILGGYLYFFFEKITLKLSKPIQKYTIIRCVIAGLLLGIVGTYLPYILSNEKTTGYCFTTYDMFPNGCDTSDVNSSSY